MSRAASSALIRSVSSTRSRKRCGAFDRSPDALHWRAVKALALLVFIPLQLLFVPLAIVGLALATYKQLLISKRLGVSQTGIDVMSGRWTMHEFGMREDEATVRMASVLPNYSPLGMWMVLFPLWVYSRIAGENSIYPRQVAPGQEDIRDLVTARTRYFDAIIDRRMPEVEQFVVMGAGYDTRCYGGLRAGPQRFFEADAEVTQQVKTAALADAGLETTGVTFVTVRMTVSVRGYGTCTV